MYDPELEFDEPLDEMTPGQVHDAWESATNLQADDLQRLEDSPENERYLEEASDQRQTTDPPIAGGPLADAQHLASTPRDEWGEDEKEEAIEGINFGRRSLPQFDADEGEDLTPGDGNKQHKAEVALGRWGFDPEPEDDWP